MFAVRIFIGFETCLATASQIWLDLTETCQLDQITWFGFYEIFGICGVLYWKKFSRLRGKYAPIREIKFPRKKFFWLRENKFLHFLFKYLFISTDDYNTLQHNIK